MFKLLILFLKLYNFFYLPFFFTFLFTIFRLNFYSCTSMYGWPCHKNEGYPGSRLRLLNGYLLSTFWKLGCARTCIRFHLDCIITSDRCSHLHRYGCRISSGSRGPRGPGPPRPHFWGPRLYSEAQIFKKKFASLCSAYYFNSQLTYFDKKH